MIEAFVEQLFDDGRVVIQTDQPATQVELSVGLERLLKFEQLDRQSLSGTPPQVDADAIAKTLSFAYRSAQRLAYRHLEAPGSSNLCPLDEVPVTGRTIYSVDLVFRFLPDFVRLARAAGAAELTALLMRQANRWPLSSVGMEGIESISSESLDLLLSHRTLRCLYVDRVIAAQDVSRMNHPATRDAVQTALGAFGSLSPQISQSLEQNQIST